MAQARYLITHYESGEKLVVQPVGNQSPTSCGRGNVYGPVHYDDIPELLDGRNPRGYYHERVDLDEYQLRGQWMRDDTYQPSR